MTALEPIHFPPTGETLFAGFRCLEGNGADAIVSLRPICEALGIDWPSQFTRIKRDPVLAEGVVLVTTPSPGGAQQATCLSLHLLPGWLFKISPNRVAAHAREKLLAYQREAYRVLADHFLGRGSVSRTSAPVSDGDLAGIPDRTAFLWLQMIKEARMLKGREAGLALWRQSPLPQIDTYRTEAKHDADALAREQMLAEFVEDCLRFVDGKRTSAADIWRAYAAWCIGRGVLPVSNKHLGKHLGRLFKRLKANRIVYAGVVVTGPVRSS